MPCPAVWECWRLWGEVAHSQELGAVKQLPLAIQASCNPWLLWVDGWLDGRGPPPQKDLPHMHPPTHPPLLVPAGPAPRAALPVLAGRPCYAGPAA